MKDDDSGKLIPKAFAESPGYLLNQCARLISQKIADSLEPTGLTIQQFGLMRVLSAEGSMTQNEFAARYNIDRTTVTDVVDALEQRGIVSRQKSKTDRRCNLLFLTPSGKRLLTRVLKIVEKTNRSFLSPLSDAEWEQMRVCLLRMLVANN